MAFQYRQVQFRNMSWRTRIGAVVGIALALALAIALIVLSLGLALILLPIVAIGLLVARWRLNKLMAEAQAEAAREGAERPGRIIEIDYAVIDKDDRR